MRTDHTEETECGHGRRCFYPAAIGHESIIMQLPLSEHTEDFTCVLRLQRQGTDRVNMFKGSQNTDSP